MKPDRVPTKDELNHMSRNELGSFCEEIREFLINKVGEKGGHLSSNLGTVELSVALFSSFDFPKDKVIFDVGHQSYTYKLLSGRKEGFNTLREYGGMSGFPKINESEYDSFSTGHSSTSISAGLGFVNARELKQEKYSVVSVIGDGSMTGGMAYEALNNCANLKSNYIIILNDNDMSISFNVGGLHNYLTNLRAAKGYNNAKDNVKGTLERIPFIGSKVVSGISKTKDSIKEILVPSGMFFENLGITYLGPVDGHNIEEMKKVFIKAKELNRCVLIHVKTVKGKGFLPAEKNPGFFHGVGAFDPLTGKVLKEKTETYSDVFGKAILKEAKKHSEIVCITPAMGDNSGLSEFSKAFPDRYFDVGIAEAHAVTFAAGLAKGGLHPVAVIFSSFLQRAYDQILHDVAMMDLPVIFAIDRAGIVGRDGETHQGSFDIAYMRSIPNMTLLAPSSSVELEKMLEFAMDFHHPIAIRYKRGACESEHYDDLKPFIYGKSRILAKGKDIALLSFGAMLKETEIVFDRLTSEGFTPTLIDMRFISPWDKETVLELLYNHSLIVTLEDGVKKGGVGEEISAFVNQTRSNARVLCIGIPDMFVPQGSREELLKICMMDADSILLKIKECLIN